jgi:peptidoglycan/LPS O-acetylase OafA/YrhL
MRPTGALCEWKLDLHDTASSLRYRPEIDGLRAIAVAVVLLFHLDLAGMDAGFIGVDIFFVISGFLITSILMQDLGRDRFSLLQFYRKRALRILPPLLLVLVVVLGMAVLLLLPGELLVVAQAARATLAFGSNIYFWSSFDYFTPDAKENALLHTWSLGVEEQFYLVVPVLLWALYRWFRPGLIPVMGATVALSFGLGLWMTAAMPKAAFYLLPARYWELGAGAMLALFALRLRLAAGLKQGLGLGGLCLIGAGLVLIRPDEAFPGLKALWPVLGALAVIAAGGKTVSGAVLATKPLVFLGRISYSLYLWHWPLIVFWKMQTGPVLSGLAQLGLGLAAVALASFSTFFFETPFRHLPGRIRDSRVLAGAGAALVAIAALAFFLQSLPERLHRYPPEVLALERYDDFHSDPGFIAWNRRHLCFLSADTPGGFAAYRKDLCLGPPNGKPVLLMLGDSLSAHLWHAVQDVLPQVRVLQADASGCRPFPEQPAYAACGDLLRFIYDDWLPANTPELVVLSARWQPGEQGLARQAVEHLLRAGAKQVIVLGPTVEYQGALSKLLARDILTGQDRAAQLVDRARWQVSAELQGALQGSGAGYVDLLAMLCPGGLCQTWVPSSEAGPRVPMAFDYGHYTPEGAGYVAAALAPLLRPSLGLAAKP